VSQGDSAVQSNTKRLFPRSLELGANLKARIRDGERCVGAFVRIPSPDIVELLAAAEYDFVVADAEHGAITAETLMHMARAADAAEIPLIVRIAETHETGAWPRFLDVGVAGVQLPRINSASDAEAQIAGLFHPPVGDRGLGGGRWAGYGASSPLGEVTRRLPELLFVALQLEHTDAIEALDDLLELEAADVLFVGTVDLAASMGHFGDRSHPGVVETVVSTVARIIAAGRAAGVMAATLDEACLYAGQGASYVMLGSDGLLQAAARQAREAILKC
jgi:2-keto-3-deoxy-L-rhamnonate aldolase RhmA